MGLKSAIKPLFMKGLEALAHLRRLFGKNARIHGLVAPLVVLLASYPKRHDVPGWRR